MRHQLKQRIKGLLVVLDLWDDEAMDTIARETAIWEHPPPIVEEPPAAPEPELTPQDDDWQAQFEAALAELEAEDELDEVEASVPFAMSGPDLSVPAELEEAPVKGPDIPEEDRQMTFTMENVEKVLDEMVRPALQYDGGDIALVKIENNDVYVRLVGACSSCPSSIMTMRMGVERLLQDEFPQMGELLNVDDPYVDFA